MHGSHSAAAALERATAAVRAGDRAALESALTADASLCRTPVQIGTADGKPVSGNLLHLAARCGQLAIAMHLLALGCPLDERSSEGLAPLHYAFEGGARSLCEALIQAGAEVDVCIAAALGFHERLRAILRSDPAKIDDRTTGIPPMTWARFGRQTGSMRILARAGDADPSVLREESRLPESEQVALAASLFRVSARLDELQPGPVSIHQLTAPPIGRCRITIDASADGWPAQDSAQFCGRPADMAADGIEQLKAFFLARGVERFAVSLSPGPQLHAMRDALGAAGLHDRGGKEAVLVRDARPPAGHPTDFTVREVSPGEAGALREALRTILWADAAPRFLATLGQPGFVHCVAFAGTRPVATGVLQVDGALGHLSLGATAADFRGRGAQQALIALRIARARELGCRVLSSETEQVLVQSYRNLRRAGFELAYEKQLFAWNPVLA